MYIRFIHIYGFGKYHDFSLNLHPGLNIIEGDNEAGKSTLFAFIKAVFFGFESRRFPEDRYEPLTGGRFGGRIVLSDERGEQYVVERIGQKTSQGTVRVTMPNGTEHGEEMLGALLFGMSPSFYANIYAFGLTELSYLTSLSQEEVASYLYHAGTSVSLPSIKKSWNEELDRLFKRRGTQPIINRHLSRLEEIERQIEDLQRDNESYNEWLALRDDVDRDIRLLETEIDRFRAEHKQWEKAKEAYALRKERNALLKRLDELPSLSFFPENGERRLHDFDQQMKTLMIDIEEEQLRIEEIGRELAEIQIISEVASMSSEIEIVTREGEKWIEKRETLSMLTAETTFMSQELRRNLRLLGLDWSEERLRQFNVSMSQKEMFRSVRQQFEQARASLLAIRERMQSKRVELDETRNELFDARASNTDQFIFGEHLTDMEDRLAACRQLIVEIETDQRQKKWCESKLRDIPTSTFQLGALRLKIIMIALALFSSGVLFYFYRYNWLTIAPIVLIFLALTILRSRETDVKDRERAEVSFLKQQLSSLRERIDLKQEELIERMAPYGGNTELSHIEYLEKKLTEQRVAVLKRKEKLSSLEERHSRLEKEWKAFEERRQSLARQQKQLEEQWRAILSEHGLPDGLSPDGALELVALIEKQKEALISLELEKEKLQRMKTEWESYKEKLREVYDCVVKDSAPEDPFLMLREVQRSLQTQVELSERKRSREEEKRQRMSSNEKRKRLLARIKGDRAALLAQVSVKDSESFLRLNRKYLERVELLEKIRMIELTLETADVDDKILNLIDEHSLEAIQQQIDHWNDEWSRAEQQLKERIDLRGQYTDRLRQLESNEKLSTLVQERQELLTSAEEEAKKWVTIRIANQLLMETQTAYESRKQPKVLREASRYFAEMTEARYARVLSPIGEERLLVERQDGMRLEPKFLSRGAREQLFLSLRLGLIKGTENAGALPIILDDILVNFDDRRKRAALYCISELTSKHQVLYFTCSPRSAQHLKALSLPYEHARLAP